MLVGLKPVPIFIYDTWNTHLVYNEIKVLVDTRTILYLSLCVCSSWRRRSCSIIPRLRKPECTSYSRVALTVFPQKWVLSTWSGCLKKRCEWCGELLLLQQPQVEKNKRWWLSNVGLNIFYSEERMGSTYNATMPSPLVECWIRPECLIVTEMLVLVTLCWPPLVLDAKKVVEL